MFDYVLNTRPSLVVNKVWVDENLISLIPMKNQQKMKVFPNGADLVNVEQWTKMQSARVATKLKPWNTLNYWLWDTLI